MRACLLQTPVNYIKDWYWERKERCSEVQPFCSRMVEMERQMIGDGVICESNR